MTNVFDQLILTTVRIEVEKPTGIHTGTGFYFDFCVAGDVRVPTIVTNKHVVDSGLIGRFRVNCTKPDGSKHFHDFSIHDGFESAWTKHPDPKVDLAVMPFAFLHDSIHDMGLKPNRKAFSVDRVADDAFMAKLTAVEDVLMIGYPIGLWDHVNNRPVVRRGITATPPYDDFQGERRFAIDCACFPGSSGSPIILHPSGNYVDKGGDAFVGVRPLTLLGILFGGPQMNAKGQIVTLPSPTSTQQAITPLMINIGYCVKASELLWFEHHFSSQIS